MKHTNYEIKARTTIQKQDEIRDYLKTQNAKFMGTDHQIDTYFKVPEGRLKIRKGNIENNLIYYERDDGLDSKKSNILLIDLNKSESLEKITRKTHEVLVVVDKQREIYFIDNVKFHIDKVENIGEFIEIEAISENNSLPLEKIEQQCSYYKNIFKIKEEDLIKNSYSDLLLSKNPSGGRAGQ
jgi:predicted adenylyl cyclase CyaB